MEKRTALERRGCKTTYSPLEPLGHKIIREWKKKVVNKVEEAQCDSVLGS